ncbi:MAG: hypothetical protein E5V56_13220, partial [Mesorhizobium sp.]
MANILRLSSLIPAGLIVESTAEDEDVIVISARAGVKVWVCPLCGKSLSRVHSQYVRRSYGDGRRPALCQSEVAKHHLEVSMQANTTKAPAAIRVDLAAIFVSLELSRSKWLV